MEDGLKSPCPIPCPCCCGGESFTGRSRRPDPLPRSPAPSSFCLPPHFLSPISHTHCLLLLLPASLPFTPFHMPFHAHVPPPPTSCLCLSLYPHFGPHPLPSSDCAQSLPPDPLPPTAYSLLQLCSSWAVSNSSSPAPVPDAVVTPGQAWLMLGVIEPEQKVREGGRRLLVEQAAWSPLCYPQTIPCHQWSSSTCLAAIPLPYHTNCPRLGQAVVQLQPWTWGQSWSWASAYPRPVLKSKTRLFPPPRPPRWLGEEENRCLQLK